MVLIAEQFIAKKELNFRNKDKQKRANELVMISLNPLLTFSLKYSGLIIY
jgi:hypothetical protein